MIRKIISFLALLVANGLRLRFTEAVCLKTNSHNLDKIAIYLIQQLLEKLNKIKPKIYLVNELLYKTFYCSLVLLISDTMTYKSLIKYT